MRRIINMTICTLTDAAIHQIDTICAENNCYAVSLNLKGGGCAGFEYDWGTIATAEEVEAKDLVIEAKDGKFVIGAYSMMFLFGTEVDYVKSIVGSNFEIKNPNAMSACGCGVSVNFDTDKLAAPAI
jgi:iron-sulfur cluster assembly protein|tara:strand:- start:1249 stop:1629 length:381 start_codon:yes stop_codon:yes gene_type:complete